MRALCADLAAEHADLDVLVASLDAARWSQPTPAPGWAVRDQISHLAFFDGTAFLALTDPPAFARSRDELVRAAQVDPSIELGRSVSPAELLAHWRQGRADLLAAAGELDPKSRIDWYGPPMSARSFVTARLMETWAHGQDVVDALGATRVPTDRLRHVAHLGVTARGWSYVVRGLEPPHEPVHVALTGPSGDLWSWGDDDVPNVVRGPALDFCLVVTQRRHVADTALRATGDRAEEWLHVAQVFAGGPGQGRRPGQFTDR
jgi:uncharacterized protein (TIGR03084 family)